MRIAVSCRTSHCMRLLFFFIALIHLTPAYPQNISLILKDKINGHPIEFARVMIKSLNKSSEKSILSNEKGEIETAATLPAYLVISSVGYKLYTDTIKTYGQHVLSLSPEYYQLDNVVITGQYRPQVADKSIYQINIIDNRQMNFKTANNLDELLKDELSFQYKNEGTLGDMFSIRGLSGEYIKVLIDGLPVTGREDGFIDLSQIGLYNIDHIEIIEGPMSVVYGSNALAGAINIITSNYSNNDLIARINAHYETVGIYNFDAILGKRFQNNTISVNLARNFYSAWNPYDTSRIQLIKPKLQYIAGITYNYAKNRFKISYSGNYIDEELRDLGDIAYDGTAFDSYYYTARMNNSLNLANVYNDNFAVNFQAGYSYYRGSEITYNNDLVNLEKSISTNPELQDTTTFNLISSRGYISNIPGKKIEYQTGFETSYEFANGKRMQGFQDISDIAGFMSIIYRPFSILSLQPGLRCIYNSKFKAPIVYAINLKFNPGTFVFRASYAKGFSAPSLKQLYLFFVDNIHSVYGNPNLKPETANNFNLSGNYTLNYEKQSLTFGMNAFYNSIYNAIQLAIDTQRPGWGMYFNVAGNDYKTKGLETTLTYNYSPKITVSAGAITTGTSEIEKQSTFSYSTDLTSSVIYHGLKYHYEIAVYYRYTGKSTDFAGNFNANHQLLNVEQQSIKDYNTLDITFSKSLIKDKLILTGGAKNLFNVTLVNSQGSVDPHGTSGNSVTTGYGRSYFIKLSFQFDKF